MNSDNLEFEKELQQFLYLCDKNNERIQNVTIKELAENFWQARKSAIDANSYNIRQLLTFL